MEQSKTIIRISRSKNIEASATNAILALDNFKNIIGQPVMVRYYKDSSYSEIDTIVAIGIKNGTGRESYKILYAGTLKSLVNEVWTVPGEAPDVSLLAHGELFIIRNEEGVWCYCYAVNDRRYIDPITGGPYTFLNLTDGTVWYFQDGQCRCEGDFYTRPEMDEFLSGKQNTLVSGVNIKTVNGYSLLGSGNIVIEGGGGGTSSIFASGEAVDETYLTSDPQDISEDGDKVLKGAAVYGALGEKQDKLESGSNIKTINGQSLLGSGDIEIKIAIPEFESGEQVSSVSLSSNKTEIGPSSDKLFKGKAIYDYAQEKLKPITDKLFPFEIAAEINPGRQETLSGNQISATVTLSATKEKTDGSGEKEDLTEETTFYYIKNDEEPVEILENPFTITGIDGENEIITYQFKGVSDDFGEMMAPEKGLYSFGYRYLYGIDSIYYPTSENTLDPDTLSETGNEMRSTTYQMTYTSTPQNYPIFCVPKNWGEVWKVVDQNGNDVTQGWQKLEGIYIKRLDDTIDVEYYAYQKTIPAGATNFSYTFMIH